jgi:hypothetical protein
MGYTHYITRDGTAFENWDEFKEDINEIKQYFQTAGIDVKVEIDDDVLVIEGQEEIEEIEIIEGGTVKLKISGEPFVFPRVPQDDKESMVFCKTNRLPYDRMVCVVILLINEYCDNRYEFTSDGTGEYNEVDSDWWHAQDDFEAIFGRDPDCPFDLEY